MIETTNQLFFHPASCFLHCFCMARTNIQFPAKMVQQIQLTNVHS